MALLEILKEHQEELCILKTLIDNFLPRVRKSFVLSWKQRNKLHNNLSLLSTYLVPVCPYATESISISDDVEQYSQDFVDTLVKSKNTIEKFLEIIKGEVYTILKHYNNALEKKENHSSSADAFKIQLGELDNLQRSLMIIHLYLVEVSDELFKLKGDS